MAKNPSMFVRFKDKETGESYPMDCSSFAGALVDSAVGGAICGFGFLLGNLLVNGFNKVADRIRAKKQS